MIQNVKKIFPEGGLNADFTPYLFPKGDKIKVVNGRYLSSNTGAKGSFHNIHSTLPIVSSSNITPGISGTFTCTGVYEDEENASSYYILYNTNGNHLVCRFNSITGVCSILLNNSYFTYGGTLNNNGINLKPGSIITGIDKVGNLLAFTDGANNIREINVTRNYKSFQIQDRNYPLITEEVINLIKRPPDFPLIVNKAVGSNIGLTVVGNNIAGNVFQFSYRYNYLDGETSVLSPYSTLLGYNLTSDTFDTIIIQLPFSEIVPLNVQSIDLCVRFSNEGTYSVIKTWNISNTDDLIAINKHNFLSSQLTFYFFNNQIGNPLSPADSAKLFDSVPNTAISLSSCKNNFFIGNYNEGYNSPLITSLSLSLEKQNPPADNPTGVWYYLLWKSDSPGLEYKSAYYLYITWGTNPGYYFFPEVSQRGLHPSQLPVTITLDSGSFAGATQIDAAIFADSGYSSLRQVINENIVVSVTDQSGSTLNGISVFKSNGTYQVGVVFYDRYLRNTGVISSDDLKVNIPFFGLGVDMPYNAINWSLNESNQIGEIPEEAEFYSIVTTKDLTYISFIMTLAYQIAYVSGDGTDTPYKFNFTDYKPAPYYSGVAFDVSNLYTAGLGYTYQKGDIINFYSIKSHSPMQLNVIGQYGSWVICSLENLNLGPLGNGTVSDGFNQYYIEIFTPYTASINETFYEVGNMYPVVNAGASNRAYSVLNGSLTGDVTLLNRTDSTGSSYISESMSSNDKYPLNWFTSIGRPNSIIPQPGNITDTDGIRYSNQFIQGTLINGLSSFDALNQQDIPAESGGIEALVVTSMMEQLGSVMLAICRKTTYSIYIGEAQIMQQQSNAFIAGITNVIGSINPLVGDYGTDNAESIAKIDGNVYWFCKNRASVVRYSRSGLFPISSYKMDSFFEYYSSRLTSGQKVMGGIHPYTKEYLIYLPAVGNATGIVNFDKELIAPFQTFDNLAKTMAFDEKNNTWTTEYNYYPEMFFKLGNNLYGLLNGVIYQMEGGSDYNNFFGIQYNSCVTLLVADPNEKYFENISIEGSRQPDYVLIQSGDPVYGNYTSSLINTDFNFKEGIWYVPFFRDGNTPGFDNIYEAMNGGDKIRGQIGYVYLEYDGNGYFNLNAVNIGVSLLSGHFVAAD